MHWGGREIFGPCTARENARIVNIGKSLPNYVVHVSTIYQFRARLDKFCMHQDVLYDFTADLTELEIDQYMKQMIRCCVCSYVK